MNSCCCSGVWGQLCKLVGLMGCTGVNVTIMVDPEGPGHVTSPDCTPLPQVTLPES